MRKEFTLSKEDLDHFFAATKSDPVIYGSGGIPLFYTRQEKANWEWQRLGDKYNFKWDSVQPVAGKGKEVISAEEK